MLPNNSQRNSISSLSSLPIIVFKISEYAQSPETVKKANETLLTHADNEIRKRNARISELEDILEKKETGEASMNFVSSVVSIFAAVLVGIGTNMVTSVPPLYFVLSTHVILIGFFPLVGGIALQVFVAIVLLIQARKRK